MFDEILSTTFCVFVFGLLFQLFFSFSLVFILMHFFVSVVFIYFRFTLVIVTNNKNKQNVTASLSYDSSSVIFVNICSMTSSRYKLSTVVTAWQSQPAQFNHMRFLITVSLPLQLSLHLAPFLRYYRLFAKNLKGHVTLNTSLSTVVYHACTRLLVLSTSNLKCPFKRYNWPKNLKNGHDVKLPWPRQSAPKANRVV